MKPLPTPLTSSSQKPLQKPLLRGHFHQAAFFISLGACAMLVAQTQGDSDFAAAVIYSLSLLFLFGISALYHRPQWQPAQRLILRKMDHAAIFILISGTMTPIGLVAIPSEGGHELLKIVWTAAILGIVQSIFWVKAPKVLSAVLYVAMGWLAFPYMSEIGAKLGSADVLRLLLGGVLYTSGAFIYALKRPNPSPRIFGYHEIFHLLVVFAAALHFVVMAKLLS